MEMRKVVLAEHCSLSKQMMQASILQRMEDAGSSQISWVPTSISVTWSLKQRDKVVMISGKRIMEREAKREE
jgi:hypothetical protein